MSTFLYLNYKPNFLFEKKNVKIKKVLLVRYIKNTIEWKNFYLKFIKDPKLMEDLHKLLLYYGLVKNYGSGRFHTFSDAVSDLVALNKSFMNHI